ncbi:MAG: adenylate/guanylate cyclase domain-containing protein [Thermohalobaculum sp.]|nr:adenylate/guanylate cyclase domain-containing protein [Thermohalobaculum sp.]
MSELRAWLEAIGCGRYADAFEENGITPDLIGDLTDDDLKELGLTIGDRKRFWRAVQAKQQPPAEQAAVGAPAGADAAHANAPGERRRLTVVFVDLVGSTVLSSRLDPEEWSDVLRDYQNIVAGLVTRFNGYIAQYLGDGVLCYFGWPTAMEDAAERAVEAGLAIIESVNRIRTCDESLACRVGIATGLVVVGDLMSRGGGSDPAAIGETMNFAARLQAFAKTNQIVISESTRRLLGNAFILEPLGKRSFKGIPGQQPIYAVLHSNPEHDRFAAREGLATGAMVGRANELALLIDRWQQARAGEGQVVNLIGEAGIGKSRICRALFEDISAENYQRLTYQCSPYLRDTALWPVINRITAASGIVADDPNDARLDKIERYMRDARAVEPTDIAIIADLIGLDAESRYGSITMSPSARRAATFSILTENVVALSKRAPVLIMIEDVHWADPTTLELLSMIIERVERERVMVLVTCRPENQVALPNQPYVTGITLNRLGRKGVEAIVARFGGGKLPPETIEAIIERTDGVPLFVEELTKAMIESGDMSVPASLHDTLMARLDRLPEVKEIAQIASVFGREFETDPVAAVAELSRQRVIDALDSLRKIELVFSRLGGDGRFSFKHALVRDAAYESLLNRRRQEIHGRIFDLLRQDEATMPGVLAQHAAEAGRLKEAVEYGGLAAEQALRRPAYTEAIAHLETALAALDRMPASEWALRVRKSLLLLSGEARIAHFGYAATSTTDTYAEIERIARQTNDKNLLIQGLYGRWAGHYVPGRTLAALEVADTICEVSDQTGDALERALGRRLRGTVLTMMGRVEPATTALGEVARLYDPSRHPQYASRFGQDVGIACKCYSIGVLVLAGRFETAAALAREVLHDLDRVNHAHTTGYALGHLAVFLCGAEILPLGHEIADQCIAVSERDRMPLWSALGHASQSMAGIFEGRGSDSIPEFREALAMLRKVEFLIFMPILLPPAALAQAQAGNVSAATALIIEARQLMEDNDARFAEAEICRVEGQLMLLQGNRLNAEALFEHAMRRASELGHLAWELRAAESLAGLWRENGRGGEARALLASVYGRFEEGHDMPSLKRVARLIAETD